MATTEELEYSIKSKAQLAAINKAIGALGDLADTTEDMVDGTKKAEDAVEDLNDDLKKTINFGGKMKGALGGIGKVAGGIGLGIGAVAGVVGGAIAATHDWTLKVEALSASFAIGLEEASALAVGWERAGFDAEDVMGKFGQIQGRLIMELEAQAAAQKELQKIHEERAEVVAEMGKAEVEFNETIAELEKERASIGSEGVVERRQQAKEEIEDLRADYELFVENQQDLEREQTRNFEKIWEERARKFEEASEKLRDKFSTDARKSRNVREFLDAKKNFEDQRELLIDNLGKENKEQQDGNKKTVENREQANARERQLMEEKSADIAAAAEKDVAKIEEANQKQIENINKRIEEEKVAFAEEQTAFQDTFAELDEAAAEAASTTGDLIPIFNELGVELFDAEGKMRPFNDIIWELQEGFKAMEDSGRKAALIADLGMEDIAPILTRGANRVDSLRFAQEKNLVVTEESLEAVLKQQQMMIDAKLSLVGLANGFDIVGKSNQAMAFAMESTNKAIVIAQGLWDQLKTIATLAWGKVVEGVEIGIGLWEQFLTILELVGEKLKEGLGFGEGGVFTKAADLLGFQQGTRSVPGTGPQLAIVEGGEEIRTRADVIAGGSNGGGRGPLTLNFNAPIFGVNDLNRAIGNAIAQYDRGG